MTLQNLGMALTAYLILFALHDFGEAAGLQSRWSDDDPFLSSRPKFARYLQSLLDSSATHATVTFSRDDTEAAYLADGIVADMKKDVDDVTVSVKHFSSLEGESL